MAVPILLYHHIGDAPPTGIPSRSNYVTVKNFEKQMRTLKVLGFQGLSLVEAMPYIRGEKNGKVAAITFDDGFLSVYEKAMPILDHFGFKATNYFVVNQISGQNEWDPPLARREPCMDVAHIRHWMQNGHEVGAHTLDHVRLAEVDADQACEQIMLCRQKLEAITDCEISSFAYPYGSENAAVRAMVAKAGYSYAVTTRKGRASRMDDLYELPRHSVRRNDGLIQFILKCLIR